MTDRTLTNLLWRLVSNAAQRFPHRQEIHGIWYDEAGRLCACDGFRAVRYPDRKLTNITHSQGMDLDHLFTKELVWDLELPTVTQIREAKKATSNTHRIWPRYDFGEDLPTVSAEYLLDMLQLLPKCKAYLQAGKDTKNAPIYFKSAEGEGVLYPVRKG